jgi:protein-disulfide isomerase/uncharacterized membrane protein
MTRNRFSLVVLLALLGGALSGLLLFDHHGVGAASSAVHELCGPEDTSGCERVSQSRYSAVGALSVAAIGVAFYGSMMLLLAIGLVVPDTVRESIAGLALAAFAVAFVADLVLFGLQAFAIGAFCKLCIATYVVNLAALAILWEAKSKLLTFASSLLGGEGKRAFVVWALGSLVLLVGVTAVDRAFAEHQAAGESNLLGEMVSPPPPPVEPEPEPESQPEAEPMPDPPPVEAGSGSVDRVAELELALQRSEARAKELQATLDDPRKLEEYQTEKAARDFERQAVKTLALDGIPFKGPAGAPVKVVAYSDFLCPFCRNLASAFAGFLPSSQGRVAIYYKNYPLDQACNPSLSRTVHDGACELALGAVCANDQGKFWPYHDAVFSQPPENPSNEDVVRIATSAGLDGGALRQCLTSAGARQKLDREIGEARGLEVASTPTVYLNGRKLEQIGGFLKAIESESKRLGLPVPGQ